MAWNGSEENRAPVVPKTAARTPPPKWRGLVALVIVVAAGGLAAWLFMGGEKGEGVEKVDVRPSQIAEVKPQIMTNQAEVAEAVAAVETNTPPKAMVITEDTPLDQLPPGTYRAGIATLNGKRITPRKLFKSKCENILSAFLTTKPGDIMLDVPIPEDFDRKFVENMFNPITVEEGDTPEEAQLKEDMIELRKELARRAKNGESIREILLAERAEMNKLAAMKRDFQNGFRQLKASGATIEEQSDYLKAAEKMLAERGVSPLRVGRKTRQELEALKLQQDDEINPTKQQQENNEHE